VDRDRLRPRLLLVTALLGILVSLTTALALVPRIRLVEVLTLFGSALGAGAALATAIAGFRKLKTAAR
jgi:hypothetical protein